MRNAILLGMLGCKGGAPTAAPLTLPATPDLQDPILDLLPPPYRSEFPWPERVDSDADGVPEREVATYPVARIADRTVRRTIRWEHQPAGYDGTVELSVSEGAEPVTFIEQIPKSFAVHVDDLSITPPPSLVIDPDPVLEFAAGLLAQVIEIRRDEPLPTPDLDGASDEVLADYAQQQCDGLADDARHRCLLTLVARFPQTDAAAELVSLCDEDCATELSAITTGDWSICDDASDPRACYSIVMGVHADTLCARDEDPATCLLQAHAEIGDPLLSDRICFDPRVQQGLSPRVDWADFALTCAGQVDRAYCDTLDEGLRNRCLSAMARIEGDIGACVELGSGLEAERCRMEFYGQQFAQVELCDDLTNPDWVVECKTWLAARDGVVEVCLLFDDPDQRNACLQRVMGAVSPIEPALCEAFLPQPSSYDGQDLGAEYQDMCFMMAAAETGDLSLCDRASQVQLQQICRYSGLGTGDWTEVCDGTDDPVFQCDCRALLAVGTRDRTWCAPLAGAAREACEAQAVSGMPDLNGLEACTEPCEDRDEDASFNYFGCNWREPDCDDDDPERSPDLTESLYCEDGRDNDCDGHTDCDDTECFWDTEQCPPDATTVSFFEHDGDYEVVLYFSGGEADEVTFVPEDELGVGVYGWGTLVRVLSPVLPEDPGDWPVEEVSMTVSIEGLQGSWRVYEALDPTDPASRITTGWWEPGEASVPVKGDRFYWLYIWPDVGTTKQEVLQLRGTMPP